MIKKCFFGLTLLGILTLIVGCHKEAKKYTGDFDFIIYTFNWCSLYPELNTWDTTYYSGYVELAKGDTLTIHYSENMYVDTRVYDDGRFPDISANHYFFNGGFITENEVDFKTGDGGLGSGVERTIKGIRR
jgi:hypothetical protein